MMSSIAQQLASEVKDLGGFEVRRILPHPDRQMVGPFIFFDHLGPALFPAGHGVDVRPHPHIHLATVTYLFEGVLLHRDSLATVQEIHPGAVNWMTAGQGITHSERTPPHVRSQPSRLHGIQTWVALPQDQEDIAPSFHHYPADSLPKWESDGARFTLIAGQAYGHTSPVQALSPIVYLDIHLSPGATVFLPKDYSELAVYSVTPGLHLNQHPLEQHQLVILNQEVPLELSAQTEARSIIIGGEPLGQRYKWWNFVSSRSERIEQAKQDWQQGRFAPVPTETEFIPLPEIAS